MVFLSHTDRIAEWVHSCSRGAIESLKCGVLSLHSEEEREVWLGKEETRHLSCYTRLHVMSLNFGLLPFQFLIPRSACKI